MCVCIYIYIYIYMYMSHGQPNLFSANARQGGRGIGATQPDPTPSNYNKYI